MVELNIKLPESFFLEEERDGYLVSAEMKSLWAVQLDLLYELDRVCRKHGIKYILDFGTLLGAIRHKGYIPWDDDIDVSMLREDYDKLLSVASQEFKEPYFLQNQLTDKGYDDYVPKLRRSDTTCLMKSKHRIKYNQGIFIDIFVFDNLPTNKKDIVKSIADKSRESFYRMFVLAHRPSLDSGIKFPALLLRYLFFTLRYGSVKREYQRLENQAKGYRKGDYVGNIMYVNTRCRPRKWYEKIIYMPFENLMLPVPECYDLLLRECFGDYMTPIQGGGVHTMIFYDVNQSYRNIIADKAFMTCLMNEISE